MASIVSPTLKVENDPERLANKKQKMDPFDTGKRGPHIVSQEEWLEARKELLAEEKAFTRARDALSKKRREMPWVKVDKNYTFTDTGGSKVSLADLFGDCSQLVVYHFMLGKDWDEGCKSCSFWADNYDGTQMHLRARDVAFVVISIAPIEQIEAFKKRMGWSFRWVSSAGSDFNRDYHVSFTPEETENGEAYYNYKKTRFPATEAPGISVFAKKDGSVYHTYSCYSRGLDMMNGTYHTLDLVPKGRDEDGLGYTMEWVRHHDKY